MKKYLVFVLTFYCATVFADCPVPLQKININTSVDEIKYNYKTSSADISKLDSQLDSHENSKYLGLYYGEKTIEVEPTIVVEDISKKSCAAITEVDVSIKLKSHIWIAKEAQTINCLNDVVNKHELKHYQFEVDALNKSKVLLESLIKQKLSSNFFVEKVGDVDNEMKNKADETIQLVKSFLNEQIYPLHQSIDTNENYRSEFSVCSKQDRSVVSSLVEN